MDGIVGGVVLECAVEKNVWEVVLNNGVVEVGYGSVPQGEVERGGAVASVNVESSGSGKDGVIPVADVEPCETVAGVDIQVSVLCELRIENECPQ